MATKTPRNAVIINLPARLYKDGSECFPARDVTLTTVRLGSGTEVHLIEPGSPLAWCRNRSRKLHGFDGFKIDQVTCLDCRKSLGL